MPQIKLIMIVVILVLGWGAALYAGRPVRDVRRPVASYLALGDSHTIGESVGPGDRYPQQLVEMLRESDHLLCRDPDIIAVTGWTTGDLLEAISAIKPAPAFQAVSLLIGVNNQYQGRSQ